MHEDVQLDEQACIIPVGWAMRPLRRWEGQPNRVQLDEQQCHDPVGWTMVFSWMNVSCSELCTSWMTRLSYSLAVFIISTDQRHHELDHPHLTLPRLGGGGGQKHMFALGLLCSLQSVAEDLHQVVPIFQSYTDPHQTLWNTPRGSPVQFSVVDEDSERT